MIVSSSKSSTRIARREQLGMDYGTASHRLRKQIMFMMIQETGRDTCFKCGCLIECIDELSVEHKLPWLHIDPKLFWDLDNIAFSHLKCNKPHRYAGGKTKRWNEDQTKLWCNGCEDHINLSEFSKFGSFYRTYCNKCRTKDKKTR